MIANAYDLKTTVEQVSGCKQKFDKAWTCLKIFIKELCTSAKNNINC